MYKFAGLLPLLALAALLAGPAWAQDQPGLTE